MPILSVFFGIVIRMYFFDNKQHYLPHIHVEYQGQKAVFDINSGELIEGSLPPQTAAARSGVDRTAPRRTAS